MSVQIQQITEKFNEKLKTISIEKIKMYQKLMQYRKELYVYEKAKENDEEDFERLNPNERFLERAQRFFGNSNLTIAQCIQNLENATKEVRNLVEEYRKAIKQYYVENKKLLYTVRGTKHETIRRSRNIVNQYEAERGDWVFATSTPKEKNTYRIRGKGGMYGLGEDVAIYFGDVVEPKSGKLLLIKPLYYYTLKSDKFMPVVCINNTKNNPNDFHFEFGEEWTSDQDITQEDIIDVEEYRDVTDILENVQVISTKDKDTMQKFFENRNESTDQLKEIAKNAIQSGNCTYWNFVLNRNINTFFKPVLKKNAIVSLSKGMLGEKEFLNKYENRS